MLLTIFVINTMPVNNRLSPKQRAGALALIENALPRDRSVRLSTTSRGDVELRTRRHRSRLALEISDSGTSAASRDRAIQTVYVLSGSTRKHRERLRAADASFVDVTRRIVRLRAPGVLIDRTDVSDPTAARRPQRPGRNPFSDRASLITRALLEDLGREWTLEEMAARVRLSPSMVSRALKELRGRHLIDAPETRQRPLRFRLLDPWPLFLNWTEHYRWTDNHMISVAAPIGDPASSLTRIGRALRSLPSRPKWAFTLHAAAALVSPHASWDTVHVYVGVEDPIALLDTSATAGWPVSEQGRLVLMAPKYREAVWWGSRQLGHGRRTVSVVQTLVDLWHYPVRGREQAEHLSRTLKWPQHGSVDEHD